PTRTNRRYLDGTLVLETEHETADGSVAVIDFMPIRDVEPHLVRMVQGRRGTVRMRMELVIRFDYGAIVPWVQRIADGVAAIAGPNVLVLRTPVEIRGENLTTVAEFSVSEGEHIPFVLSWHPSHLPAPAPIDPQTAWNETAAWWREWSGRCTYAGPWREKV